MAKRKDKKRRTATPGWKTVAFAAAMTAMAALTATAEEPERPAAETEAATEAQTETTATGAETTGFGECSRETLEGGDHALHFANGFVFFEPREWDGRTSYSTDGKGILRMALDGPDGPEVVASVTEAGKGNADAELTGVVDGMECRMETVGDGWTDDDLEIAGVALETCWFAKPSGFDGGERVEVEVETEAETESLEARVEAAARRVAPRTVGPDGR